MDKLIKDIKKLIPKRIKYIVKILIYNIKILYYLIVSKYYKEEINKLINWNKIKAIIIYLPAIDWNINLFQRPHQLAKELSKINYLFIFITTNVIDKIEGLYLLKENLILTNLPLFLLINILKRNINKIIYVSLASNRYMLNNLVLKKIKVILYDYIDELVVFNQYNKKLEMDHLYFLKKADIILATSDNLFKKAKNYRSDIFLCPNGVDYEHFSKMKNINEIPNEILKYLNDRLLIGYHGAIAEWIDYELIEHIALNIKNCEILLIGPNYDNSINNTNILFINNIHWLGPKKYEELPKYIKYFDVAILPFKINTITKSTSPIKMFEYMASGVPIVSVDLPEPKKYRSVLIAKDYDDFINKIYIANKLKKDENHLKQLDEEARKNSWENRAKLIDSLIRKKINEKTKR